jgi:hypothetical protein
LAGPVFDAHAQPRLTLIDDRPEAAKARDKAQNIGPVAAIRVSCLREDIDIYDIRFKDPEQHKEWFETKAHKEAKLATAREILKVALLREGLTAGDLASDPYAEMTICDVAISIIDSST